jgi:uncharacterized membrane protein YeaQ/YmgE (transglycosylase-associated protein family)
MSGLDFLILLVIALIAGAIGEAIAGYSAGGFLASIAVGFIGSLLGMWIARGLGLPELLALRVGGQVFPFIWAIVGATLFLAIIKMITRPTRRHCV